MAVCLVREVAKQQSMNKEKKKEPIDKWLKMFNNSWAYAQQNYHVRWEKNWKLYHNIRVKRSHNGAVRTFVPMVNSSVNTIVAALFNSNPSVNYLPNHPDQEADTEVLNEIYADFARRDGWVEKNKINGKQGLITGNFCTYYEWKPDKNGGHVHKVNVPVRDMIIDPQSTCCENWRYVGRRFIASKRELEKETIYDFTAGKEVKRYKNLDKVIPNGGSSDFLTDKQRKDQAIGSTAPDDPDMCELIEIWTRKKVAVIANRTVLIEERDNPHYVMEKTLFEQRKMEAELAQLQFQSELAEYQATAAVMEAQGLIAPPFEKEAPAPFDEEFDEENAGMLPFAQGRDYADVSQPYGSSDVDIIADQQELLNDLTELNVEAVLYTLFPEKTLDPKYSSYADNLDPRPGKVYTLPAGAMVWNTPPQVPTNALAERNTMKDEIREAIAISEISKGVSAADGTTATEIKAQIGQADMRIQEKAQSLANDFFFQEAKIVLALLQLYAPDELWVRTLDDVNVEWKAVNPRKFLGEYTPMVTLETQKRLEKAQEQQAAIEAFQVMIQDPTNNLQAVKEIMYPKMMPDLNADEIDRITTQLQPAQGALPAEMGIEAANQLPAPQIAPEAPQEEMNV